MAKNIVIFSDGTGQAGGLMPDETRSNVYKLYRATRCGPDNTIDPSRQLTFYDPGLGSKSDGSGFKWSRFLRGIYNLLGSCPIGWCKSADPRSGPRWAQAATAGSLTIGSSLTGFNPSSVM